MEEPNRVTDLTDTDEPSMAKSKTATADPILA
jgi:hypothetical protein